MKSLNKVLRYIFFTIFIRFVVLVIVGINVRRRENLPKKGPAIIVANHNSHLDTLVLINLFGSSLLPVVHPVAAADYFLKNKLLAWFSQEIIGIIPINRKGGSVHDHPLLPCFNALDNNQILILFPEGSRGQPEELSTFKKGVAHLVEKYPDVPVIPVFMHGLGKSLPKGETLLVPFFSDVFIGEQVKWQGDKHQFMDALNERFKQLAAEGNFKPWE